MERHPHTNLCLGISKERISLDLSHSHLIMHERKYDQSLSMEELFDRDRMPGQNVIDDRHEDAKDLFRIDHTKHAPLSSLLLLPIRCIVLI